MTTTTYDSNHARIEATAGQSSASLGRRLTVIGEHAIRYSVVIVLAWIGAMKFTAYEAAAIEGLVSSSPILAWLYTVLDVRGVANPGIGCGPVPSPRGGRRCTWRHRHLCHHSDFLVQRTWLGSEFGWLPGAIGGPRAILAQGHRLAGSFRVLTW